MLILIAIKNYLCFIHNKNNYNATVCNLTFLNRLFFVVLNVNEDEDEDDGK